MPQVKKTVTHKGYEIKVTVTTLPSCLCPPVSSKRLRTYNGKKCSKNNITTKTKASSCGCTK